MLEKLLEALRAHRFLFTSEAELQTGIAQMLEQEGFPFKREHRLSARERLDFLVEGIAIEVKCAGSAPQLLMQVQRYTRFKEVTAVILVVSKSRLTSLPTLVGDKPVRTVLQNGW